MTSTANVKISWIALLVLAILVSSTSLSAQVLYGTLLGNVNDPSGAAVASAVVKLVNRGTGISSQTATNDSGSYTFQNVPAGTYDLTVTAPGFSSYAVEGIDLNVNTTERHDATLK